MLKFLSTTSAATGQRPGGGVRAGAARARRAQRGISLTELLIGITVGLIVLSGSLALFSGHLRSNTVLLTTTRLNNELRGTLDVIARDVRRASFWGDAQHGVWYPGTTAVLISPFSAVDTDTAGEITYRYDVNADGVLDDDETFRISHNAGDGTVELLQLNSGGGVISTTPLTDPDLTNITALTFAMNDRTATFSCLKAGAGPVAPTPPLIHVREVTVTLTGALRSDAAVTRTVAEAVRIRNDWSEGSCPP